jgi:hypothetical protein
LFQIEGERKAVYRRISALAACLVFEAALSGFGEGAFAQGASSPKPLASSIQASSPASGPAFSGAGGNEGIEISIRFYDKRIYYPESEIPIKVTISNGRPETYRFKLAEERFYSVGFDVRTQTNRALEVAEAYKRSLASARSVFYREIAVEPGEEYSFVESLNRYTAFKEPGSYTIRASFYPELIPGAPGGGSAGGAPILSNVLILSMRPSPGLPPASDLVKAETGEMLKPEAIPPDEVVRRTITARQRSRWNEFFLYIDLESLYTKDGDRKRSYDRESDEGRRRALEKYRADLTEKTVDADIVVLPASFDIVETRYTAQNGLVRVMEKFDYRSFKMVKEYDYSLVRKDDVWYIVDYTVYNKGTE